MQLLQRRPRVYITLASIFGVAVLLAIALYTWVTYAPVIVTPEPGTEVFTSDDVLAIYIIPSLASSDGPYTEVLLKNGRIHRSSSQPVMSVVRLDPFLVELGRAITSTPVRWFNDRRNVNRASFYSSIGYEGDLAAVVDKEESLRHRDFDQPTEIVYSENEAGDRTYHLRYRNRHEYRATVPADLVETENHAKVVYIFRQVGYTGSVPELRAMATAGSLPPMSDPYAALSPDEYPSGPTYDENDIHFGLLSENHLLDLVLHDGTVHTLYATYGSVENNFDVQPGSGDIDFIDDIRATGFTGNVRALSEKVEQYEVDLGSGTEFFTTDIYEIEPLGGDGEYEQYTVWIRYFGEFDYEFIEIPLEIRKSDDATKAQANTIKGVRRSGYDGDFADFPELP